jgi:hypothetical protein
MAIDMYVGNFSVAVFKALAASIPKCHPCDDTQPRITAVIQGEILLKYRLRKKWQITRYPALKAKANRLQISVGRKLKEWNNGQWNYTLESLDPGQKSL